MCLHNAAACVQHQLQEKAHEFEHEKREEIRVGLVNIISDSITISAFLVTLAAHVEGRTALTNTIGRISQGMSQTGKAFILILAADVLMGYHSEEGWTAGIELLSEHYMVEVGVRRPPLALLRKLHLYVPFKAESLRGARLSDCSAACVDTCACV